MAIADFLLNQCKKISIIVKMTYAKILAIDLNKTRKKYDCICI